MSRGRDSHSLHSPRPRSRRRKRVWREAGVFAHSPAVEREGPYLAKSRPSSALLPALSQVPALYLAHLSRPSCYTYCSCGPAPDPAHHRGGVPGARVCSSRSGGAGRWRWERLAATPGLVYLRTPFSEGDTHLHDRGSVRLYFGLNSSNSKLPQFDSGATQVFPKLSCRPARFLVLWG